MEAMDSPSQDQRRPYRAGRRAEAAAETRVAILNAAQRLFLEHGYGKVTVSAIAQEAGTAVPTVYASTGGKASVLAALIADGIADPIVEQTLTAVRASRVPREAVTVATHGVRLDNERHFALLQVLSTAAAVDETAAQALSRTHRAYREALGVVAAQLTALDALRHGLTRDRATDILWFYLGLQSWRIYVHDCGWSWNDTEDWLAKQVSAALLN